MTCGLTFECWPSVKYPVVSLTFDLLKFLFSRLSPCKLPHVPMIWSICTQPQWKYSLQRCCSKQSLTAAAVHDWFLFSFSFHSTVEVMWIFLGGKYPSIKAHLLLSVCFPSSSPPFLWGSAVGVFSALRFQRSPWLFDNTNRDLSWSWRFSVFAAW